MRIVAAATALGLLVLAVKIFRGQGLEGLDRLASVIGAGAALISLLLSYIALAPTGSATAIGRRASAPLARTVSGRSLDTLAGAVCALWEPEERRRRLTHPHPLPLRWTTIGPPVADHWANVRSDGSASALTLDGVVDAEQPDTLHRLALDPRLRGRLVILGEPGAGKTALLLRLTLSLISSRAAGDRVPILLRLSTWDPRQSLPAWIAIQLNADYGYHEAVPIERLLPVLDGLDEMPSAQRCDALRKISDTFTADAPLVISSRTTEYLDTLLALRGHVVAAAAVVELLPLSATTVSRYLTHADAPARADVWATMFRDDSATNDGKLATALDAPLWVDLTRITYTGPGSVADPRQLLDLPHPDAIRADLLDHLVTGAYPPQPERRGARYSRAQAHRWLHDVAAHMRDHDTQDLAWWDLATAVPHWMRTVVAIASGLPLGTLGGLMVGAMVGTIRTGLWGGLVLASAYGLVVRRKLRRLPVPFGRRLKFRSTGQPIGRRFLEVLHYAGAGGLVVGIPIAIVAGAHLLITVATASSSGAPEITGGITQAVTTGLVGGLSTGLVLGVPIGVPCGLLIGVAAEFTTLIHPEEADVSRAIDPHALLRASRRQIYVITLAGGLVTGAALTFLAGVVLFLSDVESALVFLIFVFPVGSVFGLIMGLSYALATGAWGWLHIGRVWWCGRRRLPWRLMTFLADAHRRGILRQSGGVYQFRHAMLRDRLAARTHRRPTSPPGFE